MGTIIIFFFAMFLFEITHITAQDTICFFITIMWSSMNFFQQPTLTIIVENTSWMLLHVQQMQPWRWYTNTCKTHDFARCRDNTLGRSTEFKASTKTKWTTQWHTVCCTAHSFFSFSCSFFFFLDTDKTQCSKKETHNQPSEITTIGWLRLK